MKLLILGGIALAAAAAAATQAWDWATSNDALSSSAEYAASKALCRQVKGREPPAADAPDAATAASLKGCS